MKQILAMHAALKFCSMVFMQFKLPIYIIAKHSI